MAIDPLLDIMWLIGTLSTWRLASRKAIQRRRQSVLTPARIGPCAPGLQPATDCKNLLIAGCMVVGMWST